jgi:hypothetical protein
MVGTVRSAPFFLLVEAFQPPPPVTKGLQAVDKGQSSCQEGRQPLLVLRLDRLEGYTLLVWLVDYRQWEAVAVALYTSQVPVWAARQWLVGLAEPEISQQWLRVAMVLRGEAAAALPPAMAAAATADAVKHALHGSRGSNQHEDGGH